MPTLSLLLARRSLGALTLSSALLALEALPWLAGTAWAQASATAAEDSGSDGASAAEASKSAVPAIASNASTAVAQRAAPNTALARLLDPTDNQGQLCGTATGWDADCLRRAYAQPVAQWPKPTIDAGKAWQEFAPVPAVPKASQPTEQAKRELGRQLFFDPGLSKKGGVSCASCHQASKSFGDGLALSVGEDKLMGRRRAQTLYAAPFTHQLFWDGRAPSLEAQAKDSITNPFEMNNTLEAAVAHINRQPTYAQLLREAFGNAQADEAAMVQAIASFVRSIRPPQTEFDTVLAKGASGLTEQQRLGLHLFRTKARCMNCHSGALMTDNEFHDLGLSFYGRRNQDLGRFEVTRNKADLGHFRTPSLRGVSRAGPWMHNGLFADLPGLLRLYNAGMGNVAGDPEQDSFIPKKSPHIQSLKLNAAELDALTEWLKLL